MIEKLPFHRLDKYNFQCTIASFCNYSLRRFFIPPSRFFVPYRDRIYSFPKFFDDGIERFGKYEHAIAGRKIFNIVIERNHFDDAVVPPADSENGNSEILILYSNFLIL